MLVYKGRGVIDLVMHNYVEVLLAVVLRDVGIGESLFVGHGKRL